MPHRVTLSANQGLPLRDCDETLQQMIHLGLDHLQHCQRLMGVAAEVGFPSP